MGDHPADWLWFRTQPVTVSPQRRRAHRGRPPPPRPDGTRRSAGEPRQTLRIRINNDADLDAWDSDIDTVTARYTNEYRLYAERFSHAARSLADQIPGLSADVHVEADTDPNSHWWASTATTNPRWHDGDPLTSEIWWAAHAITPLPNVDVWLGMNQVK